MKTAEQYLDAQLRGPERPATLTYAEALAAVQAAIDEAGTVGQQATSALSTFFAELPAPPLPLPPNLSERLQHAGCFRCGKPFCNCEQPPF